MRVLDYDEPNDECVLQKTALFIDEGTVYYEVEVGPNEFGPLIEMFYVEGIGEITLPRI